MEITEQCSPALRQCIKFHGHFCPGLAIGYRAAQIGMTLLNSSRAEDEELITIVENNSCAVDAIQVLTGCTFGKGNMFFKDYGKMAFTFAKRPDGPSVRLSLVHDTLVFHEDISEEQRRKRQLEHLLQSDPETLFTIRRDILTALPSPAEIQESQICDCCGDWVMVSKIQNVNGQSLCIPCSEIKKTRSE